MSFDPRRAFDIEAAGIAITFSAWLRSSSSCLPFGERSKQDEQITGDSMKAEG